MEEFNNMYFRCRKLKLDENVANFWPEFGINGKEQIKVLLILVLIFSSSYKGMFRFSF